MLFNVYFAQPQSLAENLLISGSSWSACLAYCEGTGKPLQSILLTNDNILVINPSLNYAYSVSLKDNVTGTISNTTVFDTYFNVIAWIDSKTDMSLQSLTKQNKQFVAI